jgi:hypothetical protein
VDCYNTYQKGYKLCSFPNRNYKKELKAKLINAIRRIEYICICPINLIHFKIFNLIYYIIVLMDLCGNLKPMILYAVLILLETFRLKP